VPVYEKVEVPALGIIKVRNRARPAIATLLNLDGKEGDSVRLLKVFRVE